MQSCGIGCYTTLSISLLGFFDWTARYGNRESTARQTTKSVAAYCKSMLEYRRGPDADPLESSQLTFSFRRCIILELTNMFQDESAGSLVSKAVGNHVLIAFQQQHGVELFIQITHDLLQAAFGDGRTSVC